MAICRDTLGSSGSGSSCGSGGSSGSGSSSSGGSSLQSSLVVCSELTLCVVEFMLCVCVGRVVTSSSGSVVVHVASTLLMLAWMVFRIASSASHQVSSHRILHAIGFYRVGLSYKGLALVLLHVASYAVQYWFQVQAGNVVFSTSNFFQDDGTLNLLRLTELILLAPLREEVVFRGLLSLMVWRRLPFSRVGMCLFPSMLFSAIHAVNFQSTIYSSTYVWLQISLSMLLSVFYATRFLSTLSIWETILLHMCNNFFSLFLPMRQDLDFSSPVLMLPLIHSLAVYSVLVVMALRSLRFTEMHSKMFTLMPLAISDSGDEASDARRRREKKQS